MLRQQDCYWPLARDVEWMEKKNSRLGYLRNASNEIQRRQTMSTSMVGEFQLHPAAKVAFVYRIKSFKKMTHTQHTSLRIS